MDAGDRRVLFSKTRVGIPAGIEQNEQRLDVMFGRDLEEAIDAALEAGRVLLPEQVMQEDAHGVHSNGLGPAEFLVDAGGIEGIGLPHLEFVDCGGGEVVGADEPGLAGVPAFGLCFGPALGLCGGGQRQREREVMTKDSRRVRIGSLYSL